MIITYEMMIVTIVSALPCQLALTVLLPFSYSYQQNVTANLIQLNRACKYFLVDSMNFVYFVYLRITGMFTTQSSFLFYQAKLPPLANKTRLLSICNAAESLHWLASKLYNTRLYNIKIIMSCNRALQCKWCRASFHKVKPHIVNSASQLILQNIFYSLVNAI